MQLQSLAKSTEVLNKVTNVLNNTELSSIAIKKELEAIGQSYTTETLKAAIAQSTLDKAQIKVILSANGLQGELLETTADELANAASTNAVAASQAGTTATTIGLGTAFEGLWISIKKATKALWTFLTTTPAGWATLIIGAFAGAAFAVKTYNDSIEKAKEKAKERTSELFDEFKEMNKTKHVSLPDLLFDLQTARSDGNLTNVLKKYTTPILLIIDEWLLLKLKIHINSISKVRIRAYLHV